uniref:CRISPR-associated endoribonuclease Cas2 n=1 Tax=Dictyoglomus turgidum TaxID=513050 RepID=A0A7C3SMD5_9BACT
MFIMVSYDIKDDVIRRRVQKIMEGFGERVQYSVFECLLTDSQYKTMKDKLQGIIDSSDSVRFYMLCDSCRKKIEYSGYNKILDDDQYFIV